MLLELLYYSIKNILTFNFCRAVIWKRDNKRVSVTYLPNFVLEMIREQVS